MESTIRLSSCGYRPPTDYRSDYEELTKILQIIENWKRYYKYLLDIEYISKEQYDSVLLSVNDYESKIKDLYILRKYYKSIFEVGYITKQEYDAKELGFQKTKSEQNKLFIDIQVKFLKEVIKTLSPWSPEIIYDHWFKHAMCEHFQGGFGFGFSFSKYKNHTTPHHSCLRADSKDVFPDLVVHMASIITGHVYEISHFAKQERWGN